MVDEFVVLDLVTATVEKADTGLIVYQVNSPDNEKREHIVINNLPLNELEQVCKIDVNVNIFTRKYDDGSPSMERQQAVKRKIRATLDDIDHPEGMYFSSKVLWSERISDTKQGFDCVNIRLSIITE